MPGGDRTGPMGIGPRTGRAAGYCAGFGMPGYANPIGGRGFGRGGSYGFGMGFGGGSFGRGWRNRFYATGMPGFGIGRRAWPIQDYGYQPGYASRTARVDEKAALMEEAEYLKTELENINRRLDEIQATKKGV